MKEKKRKKLRWWEITIIVVCSWVVVSVALTSIGGDTYPDKSGTPTVEEPTKSGDDGSILATGSKESKEVVQDIVSDGIAEKLQEFGMTEEEAAAGRKILRSCGVENIDGCEPVDPNATVDGLIAFRDKIDKDRTFWFTVQNRAIFYVSLNGEDLYDEDQGGFLKKITDVHVPESQVSHETYRKLQDRTEQVLDMYFVDARYYDGWGVGRSDDNYMVRCEVDAANRLGIKDWVVAKVWYEDKGDENFEVVGVQIDGVQYDPIG